MTKFAINPHCFQDDFVKLEGIHTLVLSRNRLTKLPDNFGQLKSLKQLDLYDNRITDLPLSFCELTKLDVCARIPRRTSFERARFVLVFGLEGQSSGSRLAGASGQMPEQEGV